MLDLSANPLVTATSVWRDFIEEGLMTVQNSPLKENKRQSNASNCEQTP
jgi:hypothetical protein